MRINQRQNMHLIVFIDCNIIKIKEHKIPKNIKISINKRKKLMRKD